MNFINKNRRIIIPIIIICGLILGLSQKQVNQVLSVIDIPDGKYLVVDVLDGDTLNILMQGREETIRLIGVDTPETHHPSRPVQCFGESASRFTRNLAQNQEIALEADAISGDRDKYQRLLRYVYLEDGTLLNQEIIEQGYGFAYLTYPHSKLEQFKKSENIAKEENRGLWQECDIEIKNGYISTEPAN